MTSTEKVSEVPTGEETSLSEAAPAERTINATNYGSMSTDDGASQPGASDGSATPAKKERRSSIGGGVALQVMTMMPLQWDLVLIPSSKVLLSDNK